MVLGGGRRDKVDDRLRPIAGLLDGLAHQREIGSRYAWFLILLRISVMCFGYSPLKYSKVSGFAV